MASSTSYPNKPGKLRQTLGELESALASWDQIIPGAQDETAAHDAAANANSGTKTRSHVPDEMKRRTRELLNQLKEQIEELSSDEKPTE